MSIDFINIILLLAAAQGFFLSMLIFHKHGTLFANRFLGCIILFYSIILLYLFLGEMGFMATHPRLIYLILGLGLTVGPLHFLYAKYLVHPNLAFRRREWLHFSPFLLYEFGWLLCFALAPNCVTADVFPPKPNTLPLTSAIFNWVIIALSTSYMLLTVGILKRYARQLQNIFSSIEKIKLDWLRNITYLVLLFLFVFFVENLLLVFGINLSNYFNLSSLLMALYVYALGYLGLFKSEIFAGPEMAVSLRQLSALPSEESANRNENLAPAEKYEKSGLTKEKAKLVLEALLRLMQQQPYTNPDLTLNQLAGMLSISPHNLSEVINTQLQQNFFDFINRYRLEKVKQDLADPTKKHLKMLALAFDAGFSSKSAFNAIFKKHTQMTPSEYRRQVFRTPGPESS